MFGKGHPQKAVSFMLMARRGRDDAEKCVRDAMRLYQNRLLHGPISALAEGGHDSRHTLLEALRKLFRLEG